MTDGENLAISRAETLAHFAPKVPEIPFVKTLDPMLVECCIENLYEPSPAQPSDYECSIGMSYDNNSKEPKKWKQVPQVGEQDVQSIPPLKVFSDKDVYNDIVSNLDTSVAQFIGGADIPKADLA